MDINEIAKQFADKKHIALDEASEKLLRKHGLWGGDEKITLDDAHIIVKKLNHLGYSLNIKTYEQPNGQKYVIELYKLVGKSDEIFIEYPNVIP